MESKIVTEFDPDFLKEKISCLKDIANNEASKSKKSKTKPLIGAACIIKEENIPALTRTTPKSAQSNKPKREPSHSSKISNHNQEAKANKENIHNKANLNKTNEIKSNLKHKMENIHEKGQITKEKKESMLEEYTRVMLSQSTKKQIIKKNSDLMVEQKD